MKYFLLFILVSHTLYAFKITAIDETKNDEIENYTYASNGKKIYMASQNIFYAEENIMYPKINMIEVVDGYVSQEETLDIVKRESDMQKQFITKDELLGTKKVVIQKISIDDALTAFFDSMNKKHEKPINIE
ncbi:hypothetical protein JHD48_00970 [Sulfurimonas sp. SAG-AH-194-I05]|nr:hypothetical protein [Sulfurimonas sp. SAG-AH-194-I05]MDF1874299.1 hypothetical protein [Sulfurimonas sp. SAG-AH-194-I05]